MMQPSIFGAGSGIGAVTAKTGTFTVAATDGNAYFDCAGTFTVNLPAAATAGSGFAFRIRNGSGTQTVTPSGTEQINGAGAGVSLTIDNANDVWYFVCNGTGWTASRGYNLALKASSITASGLTSGRVLLAGTGGLVSDHSGLTYSTASSALTLGAASGTTLVVSSTTASSSTITGCATFAGGVGVAGAGRFGSSVVSAGATNALGGATSTQAVLQVGSTASLGATTERGVNVALTASSSATTSLRGVQSSLGTPATAMTVADVFHFHVAAFTLGAGSSVTRITGYLSTPSSAVATSSFGFFHGTSPTADTGVWCLYNNTAEKNYLGTGATLINTKTDDGTNKLQVSGGVACGAISATASSTISASSNGILGWNLTNSSNGTSAEARTTLTNDGSKTLVCSLGSSGNTGTIFGQTRANLAFLVTGVSGTNFALGTLSSTSSLWLGTNGTIRMTFDPNGNIATNTAALATNATNGFFQITTSAGAPSGVPTVLTGCVPIHYDTTNNKLYVYNGAWKSVTLT